MAAMGKEPVNAAPALADLRKEIDRIDEAMHGLLMERGLIARTGKRRSASYRPR